MRNTRTLLIICALTLPLLGGCVSKRTIDGKNEPAPQFDSQEAARTRLALGLQYLRSGNYTQARANLERAKEFAPDLADTYTGLAYYYQQVQEFAQAEEHYRYALKLQPGDGDTMNNLGVLLCSQQRYSEADQLFRDAVASPAYVRVADTYENAALCATDNNQFSAADRYYQLALNHRPSSVSVLENYAGMLIQQRRYLDAKRILARRAALPQLSAEYLWLEVQLAGAEENSVKRKQFGDMLVSRFPQSAQASAYQAQ